MLCQLARFMALGLVDGHGETNFQKALDVAHKRTRGNARVLELLEKASVSTDWSSLLANEAEGVEWIDAVREEGLDGKLAVRRVPPLREHIIGDGDFSAGFFSESKPLPLSALNLTQEDLRLKKVGAMIAMTEETLRDSSMESQDGIRRDIIRAAAEAVDSRFLDPAEDGTGEAPKSVTYDASNFASTQDPEQDFSLMMETFAGDLKSSAFICHPRTAFEMAATGIDMFRNVSVTGGGEIAGIPVHTTRMSPRDSDGGQILLLDAGQVLFSEEPPDFMPSRNALIEFSTTPTGATDTPVAASSFPVSAFQANAVVIRMIRRVIWKLVKNDASVYVSGTNYGSVS